jgi:hypothetical protein
MVPLYGVNWECSNPRNAKGISMFSPLAEEVRTAAHLLFDGDGEPLKCFILPEGSTIPEAMFIQDRILKNSDALEVAHHVLVSPSTEFGIPKETFDRIGQCLSPTDAWVPCDFRADWSQPFDGPEPPDDPLTSLAAAALEDVALNADLPGNLRREARIVQFCLSKMEWNDVLGDEDLCRLILFAFKLWEAQVNFGGLSRALMADVRSIMGELGATLSKA